MQGKAREGERELPSPGPATLGRTEVPGQLPAAPGWAWYLCPRKSCRCLPGPGQVCQMKMAWNDKDLMQHQEAQSPVQEERQQV